MSPQPVTGTPSPEASRRLGRILLAMGPVLLVLSAVYWVRHRNLPPEQVDDRLLAKLPLMGVLMTVIGVLAVRTPD